MNKLENDFSSLDNIPLEYDSVLSDLLSDATQAYCTNQEIISVMIDKGIRAHRYAFSYECEIFEAVTKWSMMNIAVSWQVEW